MTISSDLFLAVLSMDAYNREYGPGLGLVGNNIGAATLIDRTVLGVGAPQYQAWQAAGFYASAYRLADGTIVISYRGTDGATDAWTDFKNIVLSSAGVIPEQAVLAAQFYQQVKDYYSSPNITPNIILTGHSLGGAAASSHSQLQAGGFP